MLCVFEWFVFVLFVLLCDSFVSPLPVIYPPSVCPSVRLSVRPKNPDPAIT